MTKNKRVSLSRTVAPETLEGVKALAVSLECSEGEVIDRAIQGLVEGQSALAAATMETLEHVRSMAGTLPDAEQIEEIVEAVMQRKIDERAASRPQTQGFDPTSIPGVQRGAQDLRPRRESGTERAERERREQLVRVEAFDSVHDESIDRSPEYVSQG